MKRVTPIFKQMLSRVNRFNTILVVLLVVQLILTVAVFLPTTSAVPQSQGPLLKSFNPDSVTSLTIHDANNASQITFSKDSSGNWVMPNADNFPISTNQVTTLLTKIKGLDTSRLIAQSASSQNRLQVASDTYQRLIEIKSGSAVDRLYVGSSQGTNATNIRLNDEDQIYLTSGLDSTDISTILSSWIETPYFTVTQDNVVQMALANTKGSYQFNKVNNLWTWNGLNKGEELNLDRVTSLLGQLASIGVATPLGKTDQDKYGMKSPLATIVLKTQQSITPTPAPTTQLRLSVNPTGTPPTEVPAQTVSASYTLVIGQKQSDGNYVMKSSESPYYVEVNSSIAEAFTNLVRSDLIQPPATESATQPATLAPTQAPTSVATTEATLPATEAATPDQ